MSSDHSYAFLSSSPISDSSLQDIMLEVTVKTLDSQNHSFSVPDDSSVKEFKQQIAPTLGIDADKQRLIFCGRVLQDDKKLSEYNVDGKVIHLVQRPPPQAQSSRANSATSSASGNTSGATGRADRDGSSFLLGAFSIPRDVFDPTHVQNIVQDVVSGMGEWGRNATVMSRTSEDGSSVDVHINLGVTPLQSEAQARINQTQAMLSRASSLIQVLENVSNRNGNTVEGDQTSTTTEATTEMERDDQATSAPNDAIASVDVPLFTQFCERSTGDNFPFSEATDASAPPSVPSSDRSRFGEGIAQAARAAVAAAVAAAAGAAAAAARATSSTTVSPQSSIDINLSEQGVQTDPADRNAAAKPPDSQSVPANQESSGASLQAPADGSPVRSNTFETTDQSPSSATTTTTTASAPTSNRGPVQPSINAILPLWEEIMSLNSRLQPHLQRCMERIRSDAPLSRAEVHQSQTMFDWISKILHYLSHAYHNISDLYVNFNQSTPRTLRVRIVASGTSPTFVHTSAVPVQTQVNIGSANNSSTENLVSSSSTLPSTILSSVTTTAADPLSRTSTESSTAATTSHTTTTTFSGATSVPLMFNSTPSPFVFMEVGPSTITIDSISATLVDTHRPGGTTTSPSSASPITTNAGTERRSVAPPTGSQPTQSSTEPQMQREGPRIVGYGSLSPFFTGAGGGGIPLRGFGPMNFPPGNLSALRSFDPHLPCNSIWALDSSVRRRHHAGGHNQSSTTSTTQPQVGVTSSAQGRQSDVLHNVISGLVNTVLTEATNASSSRPITASASIPGFAVFASSATQDEDGHTCTHTQSSDAQSEARAATNAETRTQDGSQNEDRSQNIGSTAAESSPFPDDLFTSLVRGLQLNMTDQERERGTVAEFMSQYDGSTYVEGQSFISDLFMSIAREATFQDLVAIFFGDAAPLTRMRPAILQFVREKVLKNAEPTEENINKAVEEVTEHMRPISDFVLAEANLRSDIDYAASFDKFCRITVKKLINSVLHPPESESFGSFMFNTCRRVISEFIGLNVFCFSDGTDSAARLTQMRVSALTHGMNPVICHWIQTHAFREINQNIAHINYPLDYILPYIVYRNVATSPDSPPAQETKPSESTLVETSSMPSDTSPMSTESCPEQSLPTSDDREVVASNDLADATETAQETVLAPSSDLPATISSEEYPDVVIGSESWHNSLPRDWVPIIARDVHRQRRQAPQTPFSDAYLGGMPSKRRKVMTNGTSAVNHLSPVPSVLSDTLQQAIAATGAQPRTSIEQIKREVSQDASLQAAYNEQVKCAVQERLRHDMDYSPDRFPNTELYFNKGTQ